MKIVRIRVSRADLPYVGGAYAWGAGNATTVARTSADLPMKLDECVIGMRAAHRTVEDKGADLVCHKISNLGGLPKARKVRDHLVDNRIPVVAEDTWGGEIATATLAHFAASTPADFLQNTTDLHNCDTRSTGCPAPETRGGRLYPSDAPGTDAAPDFDSLGAPVTSYEA